MTEAPPPPRLDPESVDGLWQDLHQQVRRQVGSADRADDVVQDVFLRALRRPPRDPNGMSAWLKVVARHLTMRNQRRERNRREREREVATVRSSEEVENEAPIDARQARRLLDSLAEPYRETLRLRYLEGLEIEQIARRLGRSEGTVRSQIKRGLDRIRERLGVQPPPTRRFSSLVLLVRLRSSIAERWRLSTRLARVAAVVTTAGAAVVALLLALSPPRRSALEVAAPIRSGTEAVQLGSRVVESGERESVADDPSPSALPVDPADGAGSFEGRVVDARGRPVPGVAIRTGEGGLAPAEVRAHSDESGRFRIGAVDGRHWTWAEQEGSLPSPRHLVATVDPSRELLLVLGPELELVSGRVRTQDGAPVARAEVAVLGKMRKDGSQAGSPHVSEQGTLELIPLPTTTAVADESGAFRVPCVIGERSRFLVSAAGETSLIAQASVEAGEELEFVLPRGGSISGRLLDGRGAPASGVALRLDLPAPHPAPRTTTDLAGRFLFPGLPECDFELVLDGELPGTGVSLFATGRVANGQELREEFVLSIESTLRGRALRAGRPLAGWTVELERRDTDSFEDRRAARTDEHGAFSFPSCSPKAGYVIRLVDPLTDLVADHERLESRWNEMGALELIADAPQSAPGSLQGTLRVEDGAGLAFVELSSGTLSRNWPARVDPRTGAFSIADLPPGDYVLRAWVHGLGPVKVARVGIEPGASTTRAWTLPPPGVLEVQVAGPPELTPDRIQVVVWVPTLRSFDGKTTQPLALQPSGAFRAILSAGPHRCVLLIDGKQHEERRLTVESAEVTRETFLVDDFVDVTLDIRSVRPLEEVEGYHLTVRTFQGEVEQRVVLGKGFHKGGRLRRLPVRRSITRLEVATPLGLVGEWTSNGGELPELIPIVLAPAAK